MLNFISAILERAKAMIPRSLRSDVPHVTHAGTLAEYMAQMAQSNVPRNAKTSHHEKARQGYYPRPSALFASSIEQTIPNITPRQQRSTKKSGQQLPPKPNSKREGEDRRGKCCFGICKHIMRYSLTLVSMWIPLTFLGLVLVLCNFYLGTPPIFRKVDERLENATYRLVRKDTFEVVTVVVLGIWAILAMFENAFNSIGEMCD